MAGMFDRVYAEIYDTVYRDKDYEAETELLVRLLDVYGSRDVHSILDLGCGTGQHALCLARRGYEVTGVDRSPSMLEIARRKVANIPGVRVCFCEGDVTSVDLARQFDAALMMFAVLGYQLENDAVLAALTTARRHVRPGGLLFFDIWYGPAVLCLKPSPRIKVIPLSSGKVLRFADGKIDTRRHVCSVRIHVWELEGDRLLAEADEKHEMRFFFPQEIEFFLRVAGFELVRLGAFPDFDQEPDEATWNVLVVARAAQPPCGQQ